MFINVLYHPSLVFTMLSEASPGFQSALLHMAVLLLWETLIRGIVVQ